MRESANMTFYNKNDRSEVRDNELQMSFNMLMPKKPTRFNQDEYFAEKAKRSVLMEMDTGFLDKIFQNKHHPLRRSKSR